MAVNFNDVHEQAQIANNNASGMLIAVQTYLNTKIAGEELTAAQKTALRNQFSTSLQSVKDAIAQIDILLAE